MVLRVLALFLVCLLMAGCGSKRPYTDNSRDAELYARDVKEIALNAVLRANRSREPADQMRVLVNELQEQEAVRRPVGSYKPIYTELLATTKSVMEECEKANGRPANLAARLNAVKVIAEKLPGQVQLDKE